MYRPLRLITVGLIALPLAAQTAAPPASPAPAAGERPVVELSPFEVRAENDVGYQAANTTSGSRLNSRLRDTPAAVAAFTPEFLADIAATNGVIHTVDRVLMPPK